MKKLIIIWLVFIGGPAFGQNDSGRKEKDLTNEIIFSISLGRSIGGPVTEIKSAMTSSGFDDPAPDFFGNGTIGHPKASSSLVYDIEGTLYFHDLMGVSINVARVEKSNIDGYKGLDPNATLMGGYLFLDSDLKSVSVAYSFRSRNKAHAAFIGPAYLIHRILEENPGGYANEEQVVRKLGLFAGYSFQIVNRKIWGVAIKANYRWSTKASFGPFTSSREEAVLAQTKISLSTLNAGISLMLKIQT